MGEGPREAEPRKTLTCLFLITNSSALDLTISPQIGLPHGWSLVTGDSTIHLGPHKQTTSLVSLLIPHAARAGEYRVSYVASPADHPEMVDWCAIAITVLPVTRLEVKLLDTPDFVIAGEQLRARFAVSNRGNTDETVKLHTQTALALPFVLQSGEIQISPSETKCIDVSLKTDPRLNKVLRDNLTLVAESSERQCQAHASSPIEVIPRVSGAEDRFTRIPAMATLRAITSRDVSSKSCLQGEFSGEGTFGDGGKNRLSVMAKGPGAQNIGVLGRRDEYYLGYSTPRYEVLLGDHSYSVSELVENHRYGRGIEGKVNLRQFSLGGYTIKSSWDTPKERQIATYLDWNATRSTGVGLNYLFRKNERVDNIVSLEAKHSAGWNTDLEGEYSAGLGTDPSRNAYYLKLRMMQKRASGFLRFIHADPDYPGYFRDMEFIAGVVDLKVGKKARLETSVKQERHNLDQSKTHTSIPTEREYLTRLDSRVGATDLSVGWLTRSHQNKLDDQQYDYQDNVLRLGIGQRSDACSYYAALEGGWTYNRIENGISQL
ncbi:MAG TPA: hypothetical protein VMU02_06790, partial [bacterium]|nr:hypothetical protein [bacterium]